MKLPAVTLVVLAAGLRLPPLLHTLLVLVAMAVQQHQQARSRPGQS